MDYTLVLVIQTLSMVATLFLLSVGLAVIFGMMRVINFAHGEFFMIGAYVAVLAVNHGVNFWLAAFLLAPLVVGLIGWVVEWAVIRWLYGRVIDTMLATWGLSLCMMGAVTLIFGNTVTGISAPLGAVSIGRYSFSAYGLVLIVLAVVIFVALYQLLRHTSVGLITRATMQDPAITAVLGMEPRRVYSATFVSGAMLTGFAGALIAPMTSVTPTMGLAYIAKAFITVICAGPSVLTGTIMASGLFGSMNSLVTFLSSPVLGEIALLGAAILLLRFLPIGITGRFKGRKI
ncbi:branched-chain amino acid ABC transporter permease [Pusillimonas sp.]|uniref:branched-chain amino acid ABC transporter permease n=1 Tax=Pusillimonas sp. TaxID=3040095 RepID=UPI0037C87159